MQLIFILTIVIWAKLTNSAEASQEFNMNFQQHDYNVKFERMEVSTYDSNYIRVFLLKTFKYNRTSTVINGTLELKVDMGNDLEVVVQCYKFMSNEYRYFPMRFEINFCKALRADVAGLSKMFSCSNRRNCPFLKGKVYSICNWHPDQTKMPPYVPNGNYMLEGHYLYGRKEIAAIKIYLSVSRPEV